MTKLQQLLVDHIKKQGGEHVYISRAWAPPVGSGLSGYTWQGVSLSLEALIRRGVLRVVKSSFFYLVDEQK
jgi:hypothetical protein